MIFDIADGVDFQGSWEILIILYFFELYFRSLARTAIYGNSVIVQIDKVVFKKRKRKNIIYYISWELMHKTFVKKKKKEKSIYLNLFNW